MIVYKIYYIKLSFGMWKHTFDYRITPILYTNQFFDKKYLSHKLFKGKWQKGEKPQGIAILIIVTD